ncbi:MAG TPA: LURP-one-related family protein [Bacilli bacterium]|nr:LURP-one-related family protein [Bacilli bacterium]
MKLYIKQKFFSPVHDRFKVYDENQVVIYEAKDKFFSIRNTTTLYNLQGQVVLELKRKFFSFVNTYFLNIAGKEEVSISRRFFSLRPRFYFTGLDVQVEGKILAHDYEIILDKKVIARIHKKWLAWSDTYEIDIQDERYEILVIGIVLGIDCVLEDQSKNND